MGPRKNIFSRFNKYQRERFPFAILIFTTLSVVLSSAAILYLDNFSWNLHLIKIVLATVAGIIFMFNVRVLDEVKDFDFDSKHHPERPIQKGKISLKDLLFINAIFLLVLFFISIYSSYLAFLFLLGALIYSLVAGFDFFMGRKIRKHFFIYNALCLLQLLLFQMHVYLILFPTLNFADSLLYVHFFFVLANSGVIEVGRKMKVKKNESTGKDTYSSRMGKKRATGFFLAIILLSFISFSYIFLSIFQLNWWFLLALIFLILELGSLVFYISSDKEIVEKTLEGVGVLFYLSLHMILFLGGLFNAF
jgi:4-hydroxybenzoate polyprenyltransferase